MARVAAPEYALLRLLTYTTLYPNAAQPVHGVFVENRIRHLIASGGVETRIVAPVPWFPWSHARFGAYGTYAKVPGHEQRHGLAVDHPRYPVIPKVGMTVAPYLLYLASKAALQRQREAGYDFQVIDAHYFYPDGVAAAMLGRHFQRPVVITARGTDINLIARDALPRRMILWAARQAAGVITVCEALKDGIVELGVTESHVTALRNGVDLAAFSPRDRKAARRKLGLTRRTLLSVGGLIERKGHHIIIQALRDLPDTELLIAGDGPERGALERLAAQLSLSERVRLLGNVAHDDLAELYAAADASILASSREGWANVLLESMACGTPVVATAVWGTPEVVADRAAGVLMRERSPRALVEAVDRLFADRPSAEETRAYAERFSWDETTEGQRDLFGRILAAQT